MHPKVVSRGERAFSLNGKGLAEFQGLRRLEEVVACKALRRGGGIQRSERERTKIDLTLTSLKSSTFVNLHLVIKRSE